MHNFDNFDDGSINQYLFYDIIPSNMIVILIAITLIFVYMNYLAVLLGEVVSVKALVVIFLAIGINSFQR